MKSFSQYINEAIEEISYKDGHRIIILTKRTNIKPSELSKEDFVSMMVEDFNKAIKEAEYILDKEFEDSKEARIEKRRKEAEEYALSHYKQEARRKKYVDNAVDNEKAKQRDKYRDINSFSFDLSFGRNNGVNQIEKNKTKESFGYIYDKLTEKNSYAKEFWKNCTGWEFKYAAKKDSYERVYNPWIDLILSDEKKKEIKQNKDKLSDSIERFYRNSKYRGD